MLYIKNSHFHRISAYRTLMLLVSLAESLEACVLQDDGSCQSLSLIRLEQQKSREAIGIVILIVVGAAVLLTGGYCVDRMFPNARAMVPPSKNRLEESDRAVFSDQYERRLEEIQFTGEKPDEFVCPISRLLMDDPVILSTSHPMSGRSYNRFSIVGSSVDSFTQQPIHTVIPNRNLKNAIEAWVIKEERAYHARQALLSPFKLIQNTKSNHSRMISDEVSDKEMADSVFGRHARRRL